jgi:hypothetical protein
MSQAIRAEHVANALIRRRSTVQVLCGCAGESRGSLDLRRLATG